MEGLGSVAAMLGIAAALMGGCKQSPTEEQATELANAAASAAQAQALAATAQAPATVAPPPEVLPPPSAAVVQLPATAAPKPSASVAARRDGGTAPSAGNQGTPQAGGNIAYIPIPSGLPLPPGITIPSAIPIPTSLPLAPTATAAPANTPAPTATTAPAASASNGKPPKKVPGLLSPGLSGGPRTGETTTTDGTARRRTTEAPTRPGAR